MKQEPYYVYLAECSDGTLYAGIAKDPKRREGQHNSPKDGAKYTRSRQPVKIVYTETCASRGDALRREAQIKKLPREKKLKLTH